MRLEQRYLSSFISKNWKKKKLSTYSFAYRNTPLISTSLMSAFINGTRTSGGPIPTKTATPPDLVA